MSVVGREHQHTERATGLMLWEGATTLAALLVAACDAACCDPGVSAPGGGLPGSSPAAAGEDSVRGRSVLELGAGSAGLPSMVRAAAYSRRVVL